MRESREGRQLNLLSANIKLGRSLDLFTFLTLLNSEKERERERILSKSTRERARAKTTFVFHVMDRVSWSGNFVPETQIAFSCRIG